MTAASAASNNGGYGLLSTLEFHEGHPEEEGTYLVARYRSDKSPRNSGEFLGVTTHYFDGTAWAVGWKNEHFVEVRYYAVLPDDPEKEL